MPINNTSKHILTDWMYIHNILRESQLSFKIQKYGSHPSTCRLIGLLNNIIQNLSSI